MGPARGGCVLRGRCPSAACAAGQRSTPHPPTSVRARAPLLTRALPPALCHCPPAFNTLKGLFVWPNTMEPHHASQEEERHQDALAAAVAREHRALLKKELKPKPVALVPADQVAAQDEDELAQLQVRALWGALRGALRGGCGVRGGRGARGALQGGRGEGGVSALQVGGWPPQCVWGKGGTEGGAQQLLACVPPGRSTCTAAPCPPAGADAGSGGAVCGADVC